jgi:hypothetical protein
VSVETLLQWHEGWSWVVLVLNAIAGVWALTAHSVVVLRSRALWWLVGAAQLTVAVQIFIGVALVTAQERELPELHALYGFSGLIAVGVLYGYRAQMHHKVHLLYGFGSLFLMGLAIRAMVMGAS